MKQFLDTNILVYGFTQHDPRQTIALQLMAEGGVVSVQVLNEVANVLRKKRHWPWSDVLAALETIRSGLDEVVPVSLEAHRIGLTLAQDHQLSVYDAMIVAAALRSGCDVLFTEDLQHGRRFGALEILNPFA